MGSRRLTTPSVLFVVVADPQDLLWAVDDERYPCPGTPAMADILQIIGGVAVHAVDTCLVARASPWSYRSISLSDALLNVTRNEPQRTGCLACSPRQA